MTTLYHIEIKPDQGFIRINRNGREVLYWDCAEWEEDAELVFNIIEAVSIALAAPTAMDARLREMGKM